MFRVWAVVVNNVIRVDKSSLLGSGRKAYKLDLGAILSKADCLLPILVEVILPCFPKRGRYGYIAVFRAGLCPACLLRNRYE